MSDKRNHKITEEEDSNMGQQILSKYMPYWPLFVLMSLLSLAAAYVYLRYVTPVYEASATIIIKDEKRGSEDSKLMESINLITSKKLVENELEILKSRALMEGVVKQLFLYAPIFQKGKVKESDAYLISPIRVEVKNPDSMILTDKVYFTYDKNEQVVIINEKDKYPINTFVNTPYGILKFRPNKYFSTSIESKKQLYFVLSDPNNVANALTYSLKVSSSKQSTIIDLSFRDVIPQRAADILNQLIITYNENSISEKNSLAKGALAFFDERLGLIEKDLDSIEEKIQQYTSGSNAVNLSSQGEMFLQNVSTNNQKLSDVNNQLAVLDQVEKLVEGKSSDGGSMPSTVGINDPMLSTLVNKLYTSQSEYDKLKKTGGENNPTVIAKAEEINNIRPNIIENIKNQKSSLSAAKQSLVITNSGYNSMLRAVPQKERQLLEISREKVIKTSIYSNLLQKKEEAELSYASTVSNSRVVDKAIAGNSPVSPKRNLIFMMAVLGALGLCVVVITIKDSFTGKIKYRTEIEKMTSIPIIGEIAFDKSNTALVIEKGTRSFVAEEFRKLRISLSFLGIDATHKKLLLTSSISGEGKSFVAANLAVSISLTGKKVVLVDLDLNNPTLSKILNANQEYGVTEILTEEKKIEEVIEKLPSHDNLYFISSGSLPENPTELLANGKINSIIDYLDSNFDMVVIDTSPSVLVTDAFILSGLCNATLYVIRHNYTPKMLVKRIDENNNINPLHNPAIIFNGVKTRGIFKNNYGYGYDYVYGNKDRGKKIT